MTFHCFFIGTSSKKNKEMFLHHEGKPSKNIIEEINQMDIDWTLINSDHFKAKHYNHAKNNKKILITRWLPDHTTSYYCSSLSSPQPLQKLGCCPSNNKPNRYEVLCCCDCLSLLQIFYDYLLWNPSTNESIQLPYIDYQESIRSTFGLGYDSISEDYKILKIDNGGDDSRPPSKFLALKSGSWRKIDNHPRIFHNSTYRDGPLTFVCGAFHWLSKDNVNKYFMISLNISSEVYKEIELPEEICNIPNMRFIKRNLSVIEGMLCAFCSCLHPRWGTFKLWVMKDYGIKESWTILYNIQDKYIYHNLGIPKYIFANGQILLIYNCGVCRGFRTSTGLFELFPAHHGTQRGLVYMEILVFQHFYSNKIINGLEEEVKKSKPPSKILALKSGFWRKIDNHLRIFHNSTYRDDPLTFVCGAFHWLSKDNVDKYFMISLNISSEVYKEIPLPEGICNIPNMTFIKRDVSVIEGMFCAYCSCLHAGAVGGTFKLWVMKDYDIKEFWTILFNIQHRYIYHNVDIPKYIFANDQILLIYHYGDCCGYRTSTGLFELFPAHRGIQRGLVYTESFISPKSLISY
ncbi:hypothetical protein H5410_038893 [Solanum commersonii]|uniref:F-box associated beta-propeller type 3 domain-containing protein n=1 Tax=Solanum commersonii TaxID=4109 RepID=A0A9J5YC11_SOLCO|nr:hypothetical protein H5410_038893 [Solanum commersonii]